jgi:PhnB protein
MPVQEMFWGERYGVVVDPFGHRWALSTAREQLTPDEIARRTPPHA